MFAIFKCNKFINFNFVINLFPINNKNRIFFKIII